MDSHEMDYIDYYGDHRPVDIVEGSTDSAPFDILIGEYSADGRVINQQLIGYLSVLADGTYVVNGTARNEYEVLGEELSASDDAEDAVDMALGLVAEEYPSIGALEDEPWNW